jgi:hypothetical protein
MKTRLFAATFLSSVSLLFPSYVLGAGESIGNPNNSCNTSSNICPTTPTKFSATIYRVALCQSAPLTSSTTTVAWTSAGCENIFSNPSGETTGDIFSGSGVDLSASSVSVPPAGTYSKVVALVGKTFKMASHHEVVNAGTSTSTNGIRYVSTSSGGATAGTAGSESMYDVEVNSFSPALDCNAAHVDPNYRNNTGLAGNSFTGALLNSSEVMTTTGSGLIANSTAKCDNVAYIVTIIDKPITVSSTALGINLRIRATEGAARVNQGSGDGVVTGFEGTGASFTFDVSTF